MFPDHARAIYAELGGPKPLVWSEGTQIDFYDQPAQIERAVDAIVPHFEATLGSEAGVRS